METPTDPIHTLRELRALRRRLKLTQVELAGMLGVGTHAVRRMESGDVRDEPRKGRGRRRRWLTKTILESANELLRRWENHPQTFGHKASKCPLCGTEKVA